MQSFIACVLVVLAFVTTMSTGKTATKVGIAGIATVGGSSDSYDAENIESQNARVPSGSGEFTNEVAKLKHEILVKRKYDKAIRPVKGHLNSVPVTFDFSIRQLLDLNEKNQVLTSYMFSRLFWIDEFLKWDPNDFNNISSIWLPTSSLWRPDIALYEDTGNRDYTATRMPFVEVSNDGRVRYLEPIVIESSCSVNIADFPFDYQVCTLSFVPWTMPTSKVDLSAQRPQEEMYKDIERYFVSTGEWALHNITVQKRSQNWGTVIKSNSNERYINTTKLVFNPETNKTEEVFTYYEDTSHIRYYMMSPTATVASVAPDRVTDLFWSEMIYTLHLRRNSSLYMQSMLFPAILLTTIAVLGFYLPPDSGERIGLQITILLTFMVFLLTVGEMFPASSGPYLGFYYVTCMALLGVNLAMTVVVLHMHYMPLAAVVEDEKGPNGELRTKTPLFWIRFLIYLAKTSEKKGKCCIGKRTDPPGTNNNKTIDMEINRVSETKFCNNGKSYSEGNLHTILFNNENIKRRRVALINKDANSNPAIAKCLAAKINSSKKNSLDGNGDVDDITENKKILSNIPHNMVLLTKYIQEENEDLRERNMMSEIENKWKAMARTVDGIALKLYLALLFICHFAILVAALTDDRRYTTAANM